MAVVMGDLVEFFEAQGQALDKMEASSPGSLLDTKYTSCIKVNGIPILPPVLTQKRRSEMKALRREAMKMENRCKSKKSEKLVAKVQSIVAGVEERRAGKDDSSSSTSASKTITLDGQKHSKLLDTRKQSKHDSVSSNKTEKYTRSDNLETAKVLKDSQLGIRSKETRRKLPQQPKPQITDTAVEVVTKMPTPPKETKHQHMGGLNTKFGAFEQKRAARLSLKASSRRSISQPDLREMNEEKSMNNKILNMKNISSSEMDLSWKGTEDVDENAQSTKHQSDLFSHASTEIPKWNRLKSEGKGERSKSNSFVEKMAEDISHTHDFGTGTASDFASLEDCNSLPQDLNGMPFTSVRQQQISHVLAKLSKVLNIQDTLTSTLGSIGVTEAEEKPRDLIGTRVSDNPLHRKIVLTESDSDKVSINTDSKSESSSSFVDNNPPKTSPSSGTSSTSYLTSPSPSRGSTASDTPNTASNSILSSGGNTSGNSSKNRMSPTASILSSGSSVSISHPKGPKMSPKNLKNTVHFSSFVTEISTSASQSVEDKISVRKLDITPTSSIQFHEGNRQSSFFSDLQQTEFNSGSEQLKNSGSDHFLLNDGGGVDRPPDSMLSRVALSPEDDSPTAKQLVFFDSVNTDNLPFHTYSSEGEPNSSDKENMECGAIIPSLHSTNLHGRHVPTLRQDQSQSKYPRREMINELQSAGNLTTMTDFRSQNDLPKSFSESGQDVRRHPVSTSGTQGISVKSSIKSQSSESESSTLKGSQDPMSSHAYSTEKNILGRDRTGYGDYSRTLAGMGYKDSNTLSSRDKQKMNNLVQSESPESNTDNFSPVNDIMQEVKRIRKHVRKGSYTSDQPSPSLLRSVVQSQMTDSRDDKVAIVERADTDIGSSASKPVNTDCNVDCEEGDDEMKASHPRLEEVYAEKEAKAAHLQRYLSQVREQEHSPQVSSQEPSHSKNSNKINFSKLYNVTDITSTIQSFTESLASMHHLSEEELICLQAEHFETLRASLIEQQKQQLEELFVQQRKEQLHLQTDIEQYHQHLKEQESMLRSSDESTNASRIPPTKKNDLSHESNSSHKSNKQFSYVPSPKIYTHSHDRENRSHFSTPDQSELFDPSPLQRKSHRPVLRSPVKAAAYSRRTVTVFVPERAYDPDMQAKFERVSACVKGYLTRRLLETEKVQSIQKTIKDTRDFATSFQSETPLRKGNYSQQDLHLLERIIAQLQAALLDIHEIFFIIPIHERMAILSHDRQLHRDKEYKTEEQRRSLGSGSQRRISSATLKAIERKKRAQEAESAVFGDIRPSSAPPATSSPRIRSYSKDLRALRPIQGQISPIHPDRSSRDISRKERPKTAPEKASALIKSSNTSILGRQGKTTSSKPRITSSRVGKSKSGKAWR